MNILYQNETGVYEVTGINICTYHISEQVKLQVITQEEFYIGDCEYGPIWAAGKPVDFKPALDRMHELIRTAADTVGYVVITRVDF